MFAQNKINIITPPRNENATIWRYTDFTKFLSLLERKALFFTRISQLCKEDKFEASIPKRNLKQRKLLLESAPDDMRTRVYTGISRAHRDARKFTYVSCWSCFRHEIAALWKLYIRSNEGIAIRSSYKRLKESIEEDEKIVFIGLVKYIDYDRDAFPETNFLNPVMHKRKSFQFERELRAVVLGDPVGKQSGTYVKVDLQKLISEIYISPQGEDWFLELVKSIVEKYDLKKEVKRSKLDTDPIY